ncbi:MAG: PVC-type heme-binding CxxCH protein [Runella sp.]
MKKLIPVCIVAVFAWHCTTQRSTKKTDIQNTTPRRLEILFLGDNGHHRPIERVPVLMAALGSKGINFTYSDDLNDLNSDYLSHFDGVLLYANWDTISKPQERALVDYIASGKGFIPVHCASYCFRNSPELVKIMGGQFWRHTWDTIRPVWTRPDHPAIMGLKAFKTLDETYLHTHLQPDNLVLTEREIQPDQYKDRPNQKTEPYTWVRTHGKGRIFYTAYGHDENTWNRPEFVEMLEKGIRWAVGEKALKDWEALAPQPFKYTEAKLPNYEKRPGPQLMQGPLSPEESKKHIQIPPGFTLSLFAAEPNVQHPIAMSWDERGRLYVLITKDYPNDRKDENGSDYILICEDTDNDGKADKFTRFAEGLSIPTGMVFANDGLIVAQAPHILFLKDTDGDDKADVKQILFSGFGTFDTHAGPSSLRYGFDNWIWGCVGYSGFEGKPKENADSLKFGQAFFRFQPDGSKIEWMTSTSNNTWGFAFNEAGDVFGSTANNSHGWYMAIPHRYFIGNLGMGRDNGSRSTDTHKDMKTITPRIRQVDVFGGYTAAAGHNFYTARAFPKKYWNKIAFVAEPTGHVLHQNEMIKKGTDYEDKEAFNLMAGADEWFAPVFAEVGPDGAVWVADWYSFIIQHNPKPEGFTMGKGNAYETDLRDYTRGRIYRVAYQKAPNYTPISLSKNRPEDLITHLKNPNMLWRQHAQRLLVERGKPDVVPQLLAMLEDKSVDEIGLNVGVIHALWTLQGLGQVESIKWDNLLQHPSPAVRKNAVQAMLPTATNAQTLLTNQCLNDSEPLVVLNTLLKLTETPLSSDIEKAVMARLESATEADDRWLPDAFSVMLNAHNGKLLRSYLAKKAMSNQPVANSSQQPAYHHHHHNMASSTTNTTNNLPTQHTSPHIQHSTKPDLAITDIIINPTSPSVRENTAITLEITNHGAALPKEKVPTVTLQIEGLGLKINLVSYQLKNGIGAGETVKLVENNNGPWVGRFGFTAEQAGKLRITAKIDPDNQIEEIEEIKNNTLSKTFEVKRPATLSDFALERAARSYAWNAPADSVLAFIARANTLNAEARLALIKGFVNGWNPKRKLTTDAKGKTLLATTKDNLPEDLRLKFAAIIESFGATEATVIDPNLQTIKIKAIREAMKFDVQEFTVVAGKPVEVVFENPDAMQHNIVFGKPRSLEIIGKAADKMITQKDAAEKNYVPNLPNHILAATPLVNPDQTFRLIFVAPNDPGDYPFVCTFPGHWRLMSGVMKVVSTETKMAK